MGVPAQRQDLAGACRGSLMACSPLVEAGPQCYWSGWTCGSRTVDTLPSAHKDLLPEALAGPYVLPLGRRREDRRWARHCDL
mmetsp:Transcript_23021/g.31066  ORF Transcript_23021/g.31066 Transcript_23021/m.31066 type:complete len:82 (+) Transcript_23021:238-483(+)